MTDTAAPGPAVEPPAPGAATSTNLYQHAAHPHMGLRHRSGPVRIDDLRPRKTVFDRFNTWLGLKITLLVGTMVCAYLFTCLALVSLPSALGTHDKIIIVAWIAQTFLQLVLLPIIIVGQNIQGAASDKRAEQTYNDAEAILHECLELQAHLAAQDVVLTQALEKVEAMGAASTVSGAGGGPAPATGGS